MQNSFLAHKDIDFRIIDGSDLKKFRRQQVFQGINLYKYVRNTISTLLLTLSIGSGSQS
jgi:hypothetical protein